MDLNLTALYGTESDLGPDTSKLQQHEIKVF